MPKELEEKLKVALYARVSTVDNEQNLDVQLVQASDLLMYDLKRLSLLLEARRVGFLFQATPDDAASAKRRFFGTHRWHPEQCSGPFSVDCANCADSSGVGVQVMLVI